VQVQQGSRFERLMRPFLTEARRRRESAAASDPRYWTRVDPKLNATRLNFLLFGYGETHEPPLTERAFIGSITLFSYDYRSRTIDLVSLTHDIRAPELERYLKSRGQQMVGPIKIDGAYNMGGFDLMRRTLEDATGLAIDFQLAFNEDAIARATDRVFGGLDVEVPLPFAVNAFYFEGKKQPAGAFVQGRQRLNGMQVIQFIKTVPVEQKYDLRLEHNARKHLVFQALMEALQANVGDVGFLGRGAVFFTGEVAGSGIAYDFDLRGLLVENLWSLITDRSASDAVDTSVPGIARTIYVVDPASGDGGVQWSKPMRTPMRSPGGIWTPASMAKPPWRSPTPGTRTPRIWSAATGPTYGNSSQRGSWPWAPPSCPLPPLIGSVSTNKFFFGSRKAAASLPRAARPGPRSQTVRTCSAQNLKGGEAGSRSARSCRCEARRFWAEQVRTV